MDMDNKKDYKFNCEECKFTCNEESRWIIHINCEKHKLGKRKKRSDYNGPYICKECNYETTNMVSYKQHILNEHSTIEEREKGYTYYCKECNIGSFTEITYKKHIETKKHIKKINENKCC